MVKVLPAHVTKTVKIFTHGDPNESQTGEPPVLPRRFGNIDLYQKWSAAEEKIAMQSSPENLYHIVRKISLMAKSTEGKSIVLLFWTTKQENSPTMGSEDKL